jgi:trimethylamine corrinoid protein
MKASLISNLSDLNEKETLAIVTERLNAGDDPLSILDDAGRAMEIVGKRFQEGEYFLPELIYSGEIFKLVSEIVRPKITKAAEVKRLGKVLIGTVAGDIHDIGKNIVTFMLDVNGFEVHDLGIDVPVNKFVEAIQEVKPEIVGLSGLLTLAFDSMKETIDAIATAGLRDSVKIMIGGGQTDEQVRQYTGADVYCPDAVAGVKQAKQWIGGE